MMIPADSVLLSIGHQYDDDDLDKGIDLRYNKIMIVSEEVVTGDPTYKEKNVIKKRNCKEFISQFKKKTKKPYEISNILYSNTYCIKGEGIAIACAVGKHSCIGTRKGCEFQEETHFLDEKLEFKDLLDSYALYLGKLAN